MAGIALLVLITFLDPAYGWLTMANRVDPATQQAAVAQPYVDVLVVLGFKPKAFHLREIQALGIVGAVGDTTIQLRRVSHANLTTLARTPWISRIQPLR